MKNYNYLNNMKSKEQEKNKKQSSNILTSEDGQSKKLEEKIIRNKTGFRSAFSKDVNDPSERGHD